MFYDPETNAALRDVHRLYMRRWLRSAGLAPAARSLRHCPYAVVGQRCSAPSTGRCALCQPHIACSIGLDHTVLARDSDAGALVLVTQPYGADAFLPSLRELADDLGFRLAVGEPGTGPLARLHELFRGEPMQTTPIALYAKGTGGPRAVVDLPLSDLEQATAASLREGAK